VTVSPFLIYCDDPPRSHPRGTTKVRTLEVDTDGDLTSVPETTWLSGDDVVDPAVVRKRYFDDPIPDIRMKVDFECRQCGRRVEVRDTNKLGFVVRAVYLAGASRLSLSGLDRMMRTKH
jgi:hypothetical protein